jgi:flagellar M-ring protein FliF
LPDFLKGVGAARIGAMAGVAAALTGFFLYVFGAITEPPKAVLFSALDPREVGQITAKLDSMGVPYEPRGDGSTILVDADKVSKVRMELASNGLPSAGVGYEIFDKADTFGAATFVQNINRLRALEGELARTIRSIDVIADARVHLVIPERQVFSRDNQPPSASVMIKTRGDRLSRGQVAAIQHLVASAVQGLTPSGVAIVDDKGTLLAGGNSDTGDGAAGANEEERATAYEDRLRERVENMVASIVGPGHVRAQVSAQMDVSRITQSAETYDPDSKVVRSSQTVEQTSQDKKGTTGAGVSVAAALPDGGQGPQGAADGNASDSSRTEETVNYEISKKVTTEVQDAGQVKNLSVAVVVDGLYGDGANGARNYTPRSPEDMTKISDLVKSAIGYDEKRGDKVQVTNMQFAPVDMGPATPEAQPLLGIDSAVWLKLGEILILSITALLVGLLIVKPMIRRLTMPIGAPGVPALTNATAVQAALVQAAGEAAQPAQAQPQIAPEPTRITIPRRESMIDISQIEGQVRESSIRKVGEVVGSHPEEAMAILRTWLHQPT